MVASLEVGWAMCLNIAICYSLAANPWLPHFVMWSSKGPAISWLVNIYSDFKWLSGCYHGFCSYENNPQRLINHIADSCALYSLVHGMLLY